ncbi:MAG TPA: PQQ-binding-like beta-propeller repeat protein [Planctomycetota bacterium]|jgi:outer membrane protein assembly factor BamB
MSEAIEQDVVVEQARKQSNMTAISNPIFCAIWGALLLSTMAFPWGIFGGEPLWVWKFFNPRYAFVFKAMLSSAWAAGFVAIAAACFLRGRRSSIAYLLAGVVAVGLFAATTCSPAPWLVFLPLEDHSAWLQSLALAALGLFVVFTSLRSAGNSGVVSRAIASVSSVCVAIFFGMALYDVMLAGAASSQPATFARRVEQGVLLAAVGFMWWSCWLSFGTNVSRVRAARRLLMAALLLLVVWGVLEPPIAAGRFSAILGSLSTKIMLAGISFITIEGLVGVLARSVSAPAPAINAEALQTKTFVEKWVLSGRFHSSIAVLVLLLVVACAASVKAVNSSRSASFSSIPINEDRARRTDWPEWSGGADRNMVSYATGLPEKFDLVTTGNTNGLQNVKWIARLGDMTMGSPAISEGKVLIGGTAKAPGISGQIGVLWCFRESDGRLLWRMQSPKIPMLYGRDAYGVCATPLIEKDRVYLVSHLGDVLCLSADGLASGNRGPFTDEANYFASERKLLSATIDPDGTRHVECSPGKPATLGPLDADIIWRFDMLNQVNCWPYNALSSCPLIRGDRLYVTTCSTRSGYGDGSEEPIDQWKEKYGKTSYPSPGLIVLDKNTGRLLAKETTGGFDETFHGAHASPALGKVNGKELIFFGGGNGTCYAFEADFAPKVDGTPAELKLVWKFDCLDPSSYAAGFGLERLVKAETIATPVFYGNRVYTSIGNDLAKSGPDAKQGRLVCIDATQTGNITRTGRIWSFDEMRSTASTVAIADGLLYTADASGIIYCFDADTGALCWTHRAAPVWSSPLIADGKVFIGLHQKGFLIFAHNREKKLLFESKGHEDFVASPAVANGVLYIASQKHLYAIEQGKTGGLAPAADEKSEKP